MGSVGVASAVAKLAFVILVGLGILRDEMRPLTAVAFVTIGLALWLGLPAIAGAEAFATPALAVLDIALVFVVFKGDVKIS